MKCYAVAPDSEMGILQIGRIVQKSRAETTSYQEIFLFAAGKLTVEGPYFPRILISEIPTVSCPSGTSTVILTDLTFSSLNSA